VRPPTTPDGQRAGRLHLATPSAEHGGPDCSSRPVGVRDWHGRLLRNQDADLGGPVARLALGTSTIAGINP
jgi:hypothetical protein